MTGRFVSKSKLPTEGPEASLGILKRCFKGKGFPARDSQRAWRKERGFARSKGEAAEGSFFFIRMNGAFTFRADEQRADLGLERYMDK
jgi:hypothetical protein